MNHESIQLRCLRGRVPPCLLLAPGCHSYSFGRNRWHTVLSLYIKHLLFMSGVCCVSAGNNRIAKMGMKCRRRHRRKPISSEKSFSTTITIISKVRLSHARTILLEFDKVQYFISKRYDCSVVGSSQVSSLAMSIMCCDIDEKNDSVCVCIESKMAT